MSEHHADPAPPDSSARHSAGGPDNAPPMAILVGGMAAEPTDDTPTIISRNKPVAAPAPQLNGNLRGRTLAHFELLEPIGVGGMAAVIKARDKQLDRFVALKILPPEM